MTVVIKNVTVIGSGTMGAGIAQSCAMAGYQVKLVDEQLEALEKAEKRIRNSLEVIGKKKFKGNEVEQLIESTMSRINKLTNTDEAVLNADLVIEAIVEQMHIKQELFEHIDKIAPERTIFATNTSSLSVTGISVDTNRKDRFVGLHFFNPVPVMKLVEVIRLPETSESTNTAAIEFVKSLDKEAVPCKDVPGFVVNRLLGALQGEAFRMVEKGDASFQDVDRAAKLGLGHPIGPFELADLIGLDIIKIVTDGLRLVGREDDGPITILDKLVEEGKLGRKTGEGFYKYGGDKSAL